MRLILRFLSHGRLTFLSERGEIIIALIFLVSKIMTDNQKEEELDKIEEDLLSEENKLRKKPMPISGKSVFKIKKIKDRE